MVLLTGVTVKVPSSHIVEVIAVMEGLGFTVTAKSIGVPAQLLLVGVIV